MGTCSIYIEQVYSDASGIPISVDLSEWNYGAKSPDPKKVNCGVTTKFGVINTRSKVPVSTITAFWRSVKLTTKMSAPLIMSAPLKEGMIYWKAKNLRDKSCENGSDWYIKDSQKGRWYPVCNNRYCPNVCYNTTDADSLFHWVDMFIKSSFASTSCATEIPPDTVFTEGPATESSGTNPIVGTNYSSDNPNLIVSNVAIENDTGNGKGDVVSQLNVKQSSHCKMQIKNTGTKDVKTDIKTSCYLSNGLKIDKYPDKLGQKDVDDEQNTKGLAKNSTHTEHQHFTAPEYPGTYNIVVCVDVRKNISESNEKDNCSSPFAFSVVSSPNLTLTSINSVDGRNVFNPGENISVDVTAANTGENFGKDIEIGWYLSDGSSESLIGIDGIRNEHLQEGMTKVENLDRLVIPKDPGNYFLKARIDYNWRVSETNESDNEITFPFSVKGPPPPPPVPPVVIPPEGLDKGTCPNAASTIGEPTTVPSVLPDGKYAAIRLSNAGQRFYLKNPLLFGSQGLYPTVSNFDPLRVVRLCWQSNKAGWESAQNKMVCPTRSGKLSKVITPSGTLNYWQGIIPFIDPADRGSWSLRYLNNLTNVEETHWIDFNVLDVPNAVKNADSSITYGYYKQPNTIYNPSTKVLSVLFHDPKLLAITLNGQELKDYSQLTGRVLWQSDKDGWNNNLFTKSQGVFQCDGQGSWEIKVFNVTPGSLGTVSFEMKNGTMYWLLDDWFQQDTGTSLVKYTNGSLIQLSK